MRMSAHKKFVLELRAPVERYETRSAAGCKPGTAREDDLGQMLSLIHISEPTRPY